MKPGLNIGDIYEMEVLVDESMRAQFGTVVVHNLYSTASMMTHMEWAARQHILPYLEEGEEGVGHQVEIKHLNPTPVGAKVKIKSTVTSVDAKSVVSKVEAWNEKHKIGEGVFAQSLVKVSDLAARSAAVPVAEAPPPPAAVLWSNDQKSSFSLMLKCFEHNFPCSRYDEWFICVGELSNSAQHVKHEGPFLLKYETEELIENLKRVYGGEQAAFKTDLLEPIFSLSIQAENEDCFGLKLGLKQRDDKKHKNDFELVSASMVCTKESLEQFCDALDAQLNRFDSGL